MSLVRVEGHKNLYRDERTNAIVNNDKAAYTAYKKGNGISQLKKRVESLEESVIAMTNSIEKLLKKIETE